MSVPDKAERSQALGAVACLIATLGGPANAILANGGLVRLIRSCHDTERALVASAVLA